MELQKFINEYEDAHKNADTYLQVILNKINRDSSPAQQEFAIMLGKLHKLQNENLSRLKGTNTIEEAKNILMANRKELSEVTQKIEQLTDIVRVEITH